MTINLLEVNKCELRAVLSSKKIPDLEAISENTKFELNLKLYQLEKEEDSN
ncbi:MAG: hypothetical protein V1850_02865 [Candidatus Bathyarchaeota archaeon]